MRLSVVVCFLAVAYAGHAPYLGGDIEDLFEETKRLTVPPKVQTKPITDKQRRDSTSYNAKFTDIARAYAEGYKAAIKAVQARAYIAKRRLLNNKIGGNPVSSTRSNIPFNINNAMLQKATATLRPRSFIPASPDNGGSQAPETGMKTTKSDIPPDTANVAEPNTQLDPSLTKKSLIIQQQSWDIPHDIKQRSAPIEKASDIAFPRVPIALRSEQVRLKVAKLNARARRQNIYFDDIQRDI